MYANTINHSQSKFCNNCGALVRVEASASDLARPEHCIDCAPYQRIVENAKQQIAMLSDRILGCRVQLREIKKETAEALATSALRN